MKLTIITINYNNATGLKKTIESVFAQTYKDFQYIIIDGASTDGSVELIESMKTNYTIVETSRVVTVETNRVMTVETSRDLSLLSEPDTGIYNAMNKGILMAKGEYIHFLNSGDWLVDERVVEDMLNEVYSEEVLDKNKLIEQTKESITERSRSEGPDIFVGNVIKVRQDGKRKYVKHDNTNISLLTFYRGTIQHTSAYIKRSLFDKYGLYDENLKIVSDWKWYLQVAGLNKADVRFTDRYVSCFDMHGISSTNLKLDKAERRQVLEELIPTPILTDYDTHAFDIEQIQRLKRYPLIYKMMWFFERVLFKIDKWRGKRGWK